MTVRLRPRFEFVVPCTPEDVAQRLCAHFQRPDAWGRGDVFRGHAVLHVPKDEEHIWSPFLSVDFGWHPEGTRVRGFFGPKPSVWSLFIAAYAVCVFLALFVLTYGAAQWTLDRTPWVLAGLPLAALGGFLTYGLARYGQWRGRSQMDQLRAALDATLT